LVNQHYKQKLEAALFQVIVVVAVADPVVMFAQKTLFVLYGLIALVVNRQRVVAMRMVAE
jgi:hypothetical protein